MVKTMGQRAKEEAAFITDHGRSTDSQTDTSLCLSLIGPLRFIAAGETGGPN